MKTLLRIDASIRTTDSSTRALTSHYEEAWKRVNPGGKVIRRCLVANPVPHLSQAAFEEFGIPSGHPGSCTLSDTLIHELKIADRLLIGSPLYNLSLPSALKAYFDHVVRSGATFEVQHGAYRGLLIGKDATLITARGGQSSRDYVDDFQIDYLKNILAFIGIENIEIIALEGTGLEKETKDLALVRAKRRIDYLFDQTDPPIWLGEFSDDDKQAISFLRASQADAIVDGDAMAYAALCTDDIQLLIPGREMVCGTIAFLETEQALLKNARFGAFRKHPLRVERSGNLVIEIGRQEVSMLNHDGAGGVFAAHQKYMHVFRNTDKGWRFALLMSNPCE